MRPSKHVPAMNPGGLGRVVIGHGPTVAEVRHGRHTVWSQNDCETSLTATTLTEVEQIVYVGELALFSPLVTRQPRVAPCGSTGGRQVQSGRRTERRRTCPCSCGVFRTASPTVAARQAGLRSRGLSTGADREIGHEDKVEVAADLIGAPSITVQMAATVHVSHAASGKTQYEDLDAGSERTDRNGLCIDLRNNAADHSIKSWGVSHGNLRQRNPREIIQL